MPDLDRAKIYADFHQAVNMAPKELADWLETEESHAVGWTKKGESESIGHASGRRIVEILRTRKPELSDDDYLHMRRVVGYVRRHGAQSPARDKAHSRWRYSLMNWGHDPLK